MNRAGPALPVQRWAGWMRRRPAWRALSELAALRRLRAAAGPLLLTATGWVLAADAAALTVHRLAPGQDLQALLQRVADGDVVEFGAGEHRGQAAVIEHRRLTLRGEGAGGGGPRPVLLADGRSAEGKAILVVRHGDIRIEHLAFVGARVPDGNGAGIRFERGRLQVLDCAFIDNQNGILAGNAADAELSVQDSEFLAAPAGGASLPHLLYAGRIARLTVSGSHFSGGARGHLLKSRASENLLLYNRLDDRPAGAASLEVDLPEGGLAWLVGNVIAQSPLSPNLTLLSFGAEGAAADEGRRHGLFAAHNTFVNTGLRPARFIRVHDTLLRGPVQQRVLNNLFVGLGLPGTPGGDDSSGNHLVPPQLLLDAQAPLPRLGPDSLLRGRVQPVAEQPHGHALRPVAEPAWPLGTRALPPREPRAWVPGALQD